MISPTRELATQIKEVVDKFMKHDPALSLLSLIGGTNPMQDIANFQSGIQVRMPTTTSCLPAVLHASLRGIALGMEHGGNVVVATPGRLEDIMSRSSSFYCKQLEILVLDEADRLLELGFRNSIDAILARYGHVQKHVCRHVKRHV